MRLETSSEHCNRDKLCFLRP
ncbi:hypothetical protein Pmani_025688 [Petrolisthes manimaculis]|uniref:Uncharacterized protein n=1 Tax=Petrolisthes manimaculis TaxID=1843537 RepID=A0AAE1P6R6_9EUCA|nr:hypothetical protein Pmani_025688 [Petrolisthes manimaculis]